MVVVFTYAGQSGTENPDFLRVICDDDQRTLIEGALYSVNKWVKLTGDKGITWVNLHQVRAIRFSEEINDNTAE